MAAVQEIVRWLKSGRQIKRWKKEKSSSADRAKKHTDDEDPQGLGPRTGVPLPKIPHPALIQNLPDISRHCTQSPYHVYDEIPDHAIEKHLDILRETRLDSGKRRTLSLREDPGAQCHGRRYAEQDHLSGQCWEAPEQCTVTHRSRAPRRSTPWHHYRDSDTASSHSASVDQLDQWVPVQEAMDSLTIQDRATGGSLTRQDQRHFRDHNVHQDQSRSHHPAGYVQDLSPGQRYNEDVLTLSLPSIYPVPTSHHHSSRLTHTSHPVQCDRHHHDAASPPAPCTERVDTWSDDSGLSSPTDTSMGTLSPRGCRTRSRPQGIVNTQDSLCPSTVDARWCASTPYTDVSGDSHGHNSVSGVPCVAHNTHDDSEDTYNEYDRSDTEPCEQAFTPRRGRRTHRDRHNAMTPQEYSFYLRRTENNMKRSCGVKTIAQDGDGSDGSLTPHQTIADVSQDSFDLTDVTSLASDISTLNDEEVRQLMCSAVAASGPENGAGPAPRHCSNSVPSTSVQQHHKPPRHGTSAPPRNTSSTTSSSANSQSAFRPYASQRHLGNGKNASSVLSDVSDGAPEFTPKTAPFVLDLEEKLSCRATTGMPTGILRASSGSRSGSAQGTGANKTGASRRPSSGVLALSHRNPSNNKVLSDIMRMNHDRQILSLI